MDEINRINKRWLKWLERIIFWRSCLESLNSGRAQSTLNGVPISGYDRRRFPGNIIKPALAWYYKKEKNKTSEETLSIYRAIKFAKTCAEVMTLLAFHFSKKVMETMSDEEIERAVKVCPWLDVNIIFPLVFNFTKFEQDNFWELGKDTGHWLDPWFALLCIFPHLDVHFTHGAMFLGATSAVAKEAEKANVNVQEYVYQHALKSLDTFNEKILEKGFNKEQIIVFAKEIMKMR